MSYNIKNNRGTIADPMSFRDLIKEHGISKN